MFLKNGFEETEALAALDVIRRADIEIKTVSKEEVVCGAHNIKVVPDIDYSMLTKEKLKGVILPGGQPGSDNLFNDEKVIEYVKFCSENNLLIAAICAAPYILGELGILKGKKATSFPEYNDRLKGAEVSSEKVVADGNIITAKGMGASMLFGAKIVEYFKDKQTADKIIRSIFAD